MKSKITLFVLTLILAAGCGSESDNNGNNGGANNGASNNGGSNNGASNNGASNNGGMNNGGGSSEYYIALSGTMPGGEFDFECDLENDPKPGDDPQNWWKAGNPDFVIDPEFGPASQKVLSFRCCEVTPESTDVASLRCIRAQVTADSWAESYSTDESICTMQAGGFFVLGPTSTAGHCDLGWTVNAENVTVTAFDEAGRTATGTFSGSYTDGEGQMWTVEGSFNGKNSDLLNP